MNREFKPNKGFMSDTVDYSPSKIALRSHIDKLATNLVVGAEISKFEQELQELSYRAGEAGFPETSSFSLPDHLNVPQLPDVGGEVGANLSAFRFVVKRSAGAACPDIAQIKGGRSRDESWRC